MAKGQRSLPSVEQIKQRWHLTQKEAEFTLLILNGCNIGECAEKLSMTRETGRWYCKRIMEKIGVNRQVDLVIKLLLEPFTD